MDDGFVLRYRTADDGEVDGLTGREGAFLACSFWLVDCLHMIGRTDEAEELFGRLLSLRNDLGLLSEEYDAHAGRLVGQLSPGLLPRVAGELGLPLDRPRHAGHRERNWKRQSPGVGTVSVDHALSLLPAVTSDKAEADPCRTAPKRCGQAA